MALTAGLNLLVGLGDELGVTPLSCAWNHADVWLCHWLTGGTGFRLEALNLCRLPLSVISMFSSCFLWSSLSPVRQNGDRGTSCEGQLGLMDTLLRLYRAEDTGLKTVIPSLTLVIMGALFDLRSAPPPAPPAAPAHWSTSIRSISPSAGPAVAASTDALRPPLRRRRALLEPGGSPTRRPHEQQTQSRQVRGLNTPTRSPLYHIVPQENPP